MTIDLWRRKNSKIQNKLYFALKTDLLSHFSSGGGGLINSNFKFGLRSFQKWFLKVFLTMIYDQLYQDSTPDIPDIKHCK